MVQTIIFNFKKEDYGLPSEDTSPLSKNEMRYFEIVQIKRWYIPRDDDNAKAKK